MLIIHLCVCGLRAVRAWHLFSTAFTHTLLCSFPQVLVGDQPIPFDSYCKYADTNTDELPLYL